MRHYTFSCFKPCEDGEHQFPLYPNREGPNDGELCLCGKRVWEDVWKEDDLRPRPFTEPFIARKLMGQHQFGPNTGWVKGWGVFWFRIAGWGLYWMRGESLRLLRPGKPPKRDA